jgi:tetratricopeptide (TPR) repeat protein
MSGAKEISLMSSLEFVSAYAKASAKGHLYGSENNGKEPILFGPISGAQKELLTAEADKLKKEIGNDSSSNVRDIIAEWQDSGEVKAKLEEVVKGNPEDYEAWYWIAVACQRDLADNAGAREALMKIVSAIHDPAQPVWLMGWTYVRLGQIDLAEGKIKDAETHFKRALIYQEDGSNFSDKAKAGLKTLGISPAD